MRILIVEDDQKIADFVSKGLKESGFAVDIANDGLDGLHLGLTESYNAAIVDIMLPEIDGLTLIAKLREKNNNTPIIILSARHTVDDRIKGLQKGGDDYLVKPFLFSELLARVQALIRRSSQISEPSGLSVGTLHLDLMTRQVTRENKELTLQAKEYALLEYLMRNAGRIVSKTAILESVYDYSFDPQTNVVDVLVHRLRSKIDKEFDKKLIHTARGMGYVLKEN